MSLSSESPPSERPLTKTGKVSSARKGLKVHTCFCGKSFTRAEHMRRHQTSHDENAQFVCPHAGCGRPFHRQDLFQKHQERHGDPGARLGGTQKLPGYSMMNIKIAKQPQTSPPKATAKELLNPECLDDWSDEYAPEAAIGEGSSNREALSSVINFKKDAKKKNEYQREITFMSVGVQRRYLKGLEVHRSVGWNVDPFFNMPKFRSKAIKTEEVYHHCLKALGRVGKSPRWVEEIVKSRVGFLSSLCISVAHLDVLRGTERESTEMMTAKSEVLSLIRENTVDDKTRTSDITLISIGQLLSGEMLFGSIEALITHIKGVESIIRLRGGLKRVGWNDEIAVMIGVKVMLICIYHESPCPSIFSNLSYQQLEAHFPNLSTTFPESPIYAVSRNLDELKGVEHCTPKILVLLRGMKTLTDAFFVHHKIARKVSTPGTDFVTLADDIQTRLSALEPSKNPYFEVIRLTSLIYTHALRHRIPFSTACQQLHTSAPSMPELVVRALGASDLLSCWGGSMSGVLLWCSVVCGAAATGLKRTKPGNVGVVKAGRWLMVASMFCITLTSTEHSAAFMEGVKGILEVQRVLRGEVVEEMA